MPRARYKFLYRSGAWYYWQSVLPVSPRNSRYEHVRCRVSWFWGWADVGA